MAERVVEEAAVAIGAFGGESSVIGAFEGESSVIDGAFQNRRRRTEEMMVQIRCRIGGDVWA